MFLSGKNGNPSTIPAKRVSQIILALSTDHSFFVHFTPVHKIGYAMTLELVHLQLMQEIYNADAFTSNLQHMLNMNKGVERG